MLNFSSSSRSTFFFGSFTSLSAADPARDSAVLGGFDRRPSSVPAVRVVACPATHPTDASCVSSGQGIRTKILLPSLQTCTSRAYRFRLFWRLQAAEHGREILEFRILSRARRRRWHSCHNQGTGKSFTQVGKSHLCFIESHSKRHSNTGIRG